MKKKQPVYKGLDKTSVLYNDQSEYSPEIFDIKDYPKRLTAGKNIFRFRGNLENLAQNSPLDIEIIDYNGEPIYHEITTYIAEDKSRVVSIYIYPDTSPGPATITLLTEIQRINGNAVPENWKNVYNAKWSRTVYVNPTLDNESEIIFETLPTVEIEEQIGVQLDRTYSVSQFPTYNSGSVKYVSRNGSPILIISGGAFSSSMKGGTVTVNSPNNPFPDPTYTFTAVPYSTKVKKVLNTSSILLDTEYNIASTHSIVPHTYTDFNYSSYNLEYEQVPSYVVTENSESYAIIKINNLQPLTGDISRIKTFINNNGTVGTWEQISDIELEETEIFVSNTASLTPDKSIGFIDSQNTIDTYFDARMYDNNTYLGEPSLTYNTSILNNSIYVQNNGSLNSQYNSYYDFISGGSQPGWWGITGLPWPPPSYVTTEYLYSTDTSVIILKTKDSYKGSFLKDSKYKVTLDALGIGSDARISVYLSGSAINTDFTDRFNNDLPIIVGKKIGELDVTKLGSRIDDYIIPFTADNNGTAVLLFVIERGDWYLSDIRTTSDNDPGYTPNYTRIRTLVPTSHKSDVQLNFKVEYYNVGGVKCKQINYINKVPWSGGNRYIDGEYSMLTGSLYVADSLNSGIAISGYSNSGFIRSLGYSGFAATQPGFLLWSGSALAGSTGTKGGVPYSGVGLELYANSNNYFRYSTTDSELDIRTNNIFIGNNTTFISSSNGNIKISGSNIDLNTEKFFLGNSTNFISGSNGNIRISGSNVSVTTPTVFLGNNDNFISASNGNIKISGSNVSINTPTFFLGTPGSQYISGSNGLLEISSSRFHVSSSGELTATEGIFLGTSQADIFAYRLVDIDSSHTNETTYTGKDGQTYVALNLTGSHGNNTGPATFVRINGGAYANGTYPIGNINIHDPDFYAPSSRFKFIGSIIVLEAGVSDIYLAVSEGGDIGSGAGDTQIAGGSGTGGNYLNSDSTIAYDADDMITPMIGTHTLTGGTYTNVIKLYGGTQVVLAQSKFAWRIVAMSSYDAGRVQFSGGLRLKNVPTSTSGLATGDVYKDASGFLKIF